MKTKEANVSISLDMKGIPINNYGVIQCVEIGEQRSIVAIAEKGLDYWNRLNPNITPVLLSYSWDLGRDLRTTKGLETKVTLNEGLINCAEWLINNVTEYKDFSVWKYSYPSYFGTKSGWRSAHAQGQAIQLLLRVFEITKNSDMLNCAYAAIYGFSKSLEQGGLAEFLDSEQTWYHKFADENSEHPKVLNGMLFAILGLIDFQKRIGMSEVNDMLSRGLNGLVFNLSKYDHGKWSSYIDNNKLASAHYHSLHCQQLSAINEYINFPIIKETLSRWQLSNVKNAIGGKYSPSIIQAILHYFTK